MLNCSAPILKFIFQTWYFGILLAYLGSFFGQKARFAQTILIFHGGLYWLILCNVTFEFFSESCDRVHHEKWEMSAQFCLFDQKSNLNRQVKCPNIKSEKWILGWAQSIWVYKPKNNFAPRWHCCRKNFKKIQTMFWKIFST